MSSRSADGRAPRLIGREITGLVGFLLSLKSACRLSYAELAARTADLRDTAAVSRTALINAVGLRTLPSEKVVIAYVRACGASAEEEQEALRMRRAARAEQRGVLAGLRAPAVRNIRTHADLAAALAAAYERAGAPPLRVFQERAGTEAVPGRVLLPLTSTWRITQRTGQPTNWPQCEAYLRACGVPPRGMRLWQEAWMRTRSARDTDAVGNGLRPDPWGAATSGTGVVVGDTRITFRPAPARTPRLTPQAAGRVMYQALLALPPGGRESVLLTLAGGLAHAEGRRNGALPDTGAGSVAVDADGVFGLIEFEHAPSPARPGDVHQPVLRTNASGKTHEHAGKAAGGQ